MNISVLTPQDYKVMPWKNGAGSTSEIARQNEEGSENFIWRVSIADIKDDGPFSLYPGYQRIINTLEGTGMSLTVDGRHSGDLLTLEPYIFNGASEVESKLINGPIRDFNLIYKPELCKARLQWIDLSGRQVICSDADKLIVYAKDEVDCLVAGQDITLAAGSSLVLNSAISTLRKITFYSPFHVGFACLIEINLLK